MLLTKMSDENLFNERKKVFLYGNLNESLNLLRLQNINLNSYVTVIDENGVFYCIKSVELRRGTTLHVEDISHPKKKKTRKNIDLEQNVVFVAFTVGGEL